MFFYHNTIVTFIPAYVREGLSILGLPSNKRKDFEMLKIYSDNRIRLTRGDTAFIEVKLLDDKGEKYEAKETDKLYFRLKRNSTLKDILIEKEISIDSLTLELQEDDTKNLKFGDYIYEIELVTIENYHFTIIANTGFTLTTELDDHG
jgi:uncharacterized membrane protein YkoI